MHILQYIVQIAAHQHIRTFEIITIIRSPKSRIAVSNLSGCPRSYHKGSIRRAITLAIVSQRGHTVLKYRISTLILQFVSNDPLNSTENNLIE